MSTNNNYTKANFVRIWKGALAYLSSIDIAAKVLELAQDRGNDAWSPGDATYYDTENPAWQFKRGTIGIDDIVEDECPMIMIDVLNWPHQKPRKAGDNYSQEWGIDMLICIAALGPSQEDAEIRSLDAACAIINAWTGGGSNLNMNRSLTGLDYTALSGGGWITQKRNDQYLSLGQVVLSVGTRVRFNNPS